MLVTYNLFHWVNGQAVAQGNKGGICFVLKQEMQDLLVDFLFTCSPVRGLVGFHGIKKNLKLLIESVETCFLVA